MPHVSSPSVEAYRGRPAQPSSTPWREADFCVIDLETTGLDPSVDEIISFAALQITGARMRLSDMRYQLIRPRRMPDETTILIHGLRSSDLVDAPSLPEALDGLLDALTGRTLVAHVASVERGFLEAALAEQDLRLTNPIVDTAALGAALLRRRGRPVREPIGLTPLARTLGLPVHRPHQADGDALTTGQVFLALAAHLDAVEPQTIGSLQRHGGRAGGRLALRSLLSKLTRG